MTTLSKAALGLNDTNSLIDLIADAITDSLGPDWTAFDAAHHVMQWIEDAGLEIGGKTSGGPEAGSNEWLAQSPQFHPGDIA